MSMDEMISSVCRRWVIAVRQNARMLIMSKTLAPRAGYVEGRML